MITNEPDIKVGIYTDGTPVCNAQDGMHILSNMLIGKDFHWQRVIEARLPGIVTEAEKNTAGIGLINTLPVETYLKCVIGSEMNPLAPPEFLKAHAIISRSWALDKLAHSGHATAGEMISTPNITVKWEDTCDHSGFDVCSDDHCQRYQGRPEISASAADEAVEATRGIVLTDGSGNIADARYSKCCGGVTETYATCWDTADFPYLRSFEDPHCDLSEMPEPLKRMFLERSFKNYDREMDDFTFWSAKISKIDVARNLKEKFGVEIGAIKSLAPLERGRSGRIYMMRIEGSEGMHIIGKELMIRRLLAPTHLPSSNFDIEDLGDTLLISGRGWGHGVGLCQTGAARMALEGATCEEILEFYYPSAKLTKIYD